MSDYDVEVWSRAITALVGLVIIFFQQISWRKRWLYWTLGIIGWPLFLIHIIGLGAFVWLYGPEGVVTLDVESRRAASAPESPSGQPQ